MTPSKRKAETSSEVVKKKQIVLSSNGDCDVDTSGQLEHKVGDWVIVLYDDEPFIGHILKVNASAGYQIHTLDCGKGNCFKWSSTECIWYKNIVAHVEEPKPRNTRGALMLSESDFVKFKSIY